MVDKFKEGQDGEPGWGVVEEAVAVCGYVPVAERRHPKGLYLDWVVGCQVEGCCSVSIGQSMNAVV